MPLTSRKRFDTYLLLVLLFTLGMWASVTYNSAVGESLCLVLGIGLGIWTGDLFREVWTQDVHL